MGKISTCVGQIQMINSVEMGKFHLPFNRKFYYAGQAAFNATE